MYAPNRRTGATLDARFPANASAVVALVIVTAYPDFAKVHRMRERRRPRDRYEDASVSSFIDDASVV
jgi:hypothetical protein